MSAPDIGFERVSANRTLVIADGGAPSPVGPAWRARRDAELRDERRKTARHRQLRCLYRPQCDLAPGPARDGCPFHAGGGGQKLAEIREDGTIGATGVTVTSERLEADGNTWIDMSHDGYLASHDVVHRRRLYINASGSGCSRRGHAGGIR